VTDFGGRDSSKAMVLSAAEFLVLVLAFSGTGGCPMKNPIAVKNFTTPIATPLVSVGRIM
jgi:hypothetical protein